MRKILFIINPKSGVDRKKKLHGLISRTLDLQQFTFEIQYTRYPKHGIELAQRGVTNGMHIIAVVGGDGSVNDVIQAVHGTDAALAIIPKGSGNGLSRSLSIPMNIKKAIKLINTAKIIRIDLGTVNGHIFASNAGVGFDALVIKKFATNKKRGFKAYTKIITQNIWKYKVQNWAINFDGTIIQEHAFMLTVANAIQLGYGFKIAPQASLQDGYFDIVIIKKFPKILAFLIALKAFRGAITQSSFVTSFRGKEIKISSPDLDQMQYDGETHSCSHEINIKVLPQALNVLVAPDRSR